MGRDEFRRAMVCGRNDYLMKPFSTHELIQAVESRLARQTHVESEAYQRIEKLREPRSLSCRRNWPQPTPAWPAPHEHNSA